MEGPSENKGHVIFDPINGFIKLTPIEYEIIHSPFYQRLRWIKQLGFSSYVFPGAEHSRFGHSIGVLYNAHKIIASCKRSVSRSKLNDVNDVDKATVYHKSLRIAALLHDLGTFPFSHTTEHSYIKFGDTTNTKGGKGLQDDHENLGAFIIKNTDYPGGITYILKKYGLDPQNISDLVKGVDPSILANQILHSEIDCDRMDYLLRDAHNTGLKYGSYDRDYLTYHFEIKNVDNHDILTIKHNALHCVEDFLMARYAWYSQVIRSPRGSKYDAIAEHICFFMIKKGLIHKYSDLLDMIVNNPMQFYGFNDAYFMQTIQRELVAGNFDKDEDIKDMAVSLLLENGPAHIPLPEFEHILIDQDDQATIDKTYNRAINKVNELKELIKKKGKKSFWIISDVPTKKLLFVKSAKSIAKGGTSNVLLERDPVKISYENGDIKLLGNVENSIISHFGGRMNFTPNVFCSNATYEFLLDEGLIKRK